MKHLPQSELVVQQESERYPLTRYLDSSKEVVIDFNLSNTKFKDYRPGQKVIFFDENDNEISYGILRSINYNTKKGLSSFNSDVKPTRCTVSKWLPIPVSPQILLSNYAFITTPGSVATLDATCSYTKPHRAGQISWSLYYLPPTEDEEILIIKGHDYDNIGGCKFVKQDALWAEGTYTLHVVRYGTNKTMIKKDSVSWTLNSTSNVLSCGGYSSNQSALFL